jgi:hypothetical protein
MSILQIKNPLEWLTCKLIDFAVIVPVEDI